MNKELYRNNYLDIKRPNNEVGRPVKFGDIELNKEKVEIVNLVTREKAHLEYREYQILNILIIASAQDIPLKVSDIEHYIYSDYPEEKELPLSNTIQQYIMRLRDRLEEVHSKVEIPKLQKSNFGYLLKYSL